jgi:hypothetical protein
MSRHEQKCRQWQALVASFERSGASQAAFAAGAGVGLASFRYWLYKLRGAPTAGTPRPPGASAPRGGGRSAEVRLVPVQVRGGVEEEGAVEIDVVTLRLRVRGGRVEPRYVASLVGALRELRC